MAALVVVFALCLCLAGKRADRSDAQRSGGTVTEPEALYPVERGVALLRHTSNTSGSVTVPARGLYRHHTAPYWAGRYRHRTRQLQQARRKLHGAITGPVYGSHWLERAFLCIHAGEGPWTIHNPPYDGGLQMDSDFQRTYGDWALKAFGSAGNWPVSVQLAVAIRAYESGRGFYPWPNTARACGLI